jgi:hypothetical protein
MIIVYLDITTSLKCGLAWDWRYFHCHQTKVNTGALDLQQDSKWAYFERCRLVYGIIMCVCRQTNDMYKLYVDPGKSSDFDQYRAKPESANRVTFANEA